MIVTLIAAVAQNGVIGKDNQLPWTIKDDMRFFVRTTKGHTVITGRKNFEAMGRALPHRRNIVVTRQTNQSWPGVEIAPDLPAALLLCSQAQQEEVFVIGGAQIYELALPYAHRFYRTLVLADVEGDVFFPPVDWANWHKTDLLQQQKNADNEHDFVIEQWDRNDAPRSWSE